MPNIINDMLVAFSSNIFVESQAVGCSYPLWTRYLTYTWHPFCSTKWLYCHRYCFGVCGSCEYTLCPFSFCLLIRYVISFITSSWHRTLIQSFCDMAFGSFCIAKVSVTCMLQEYASINVVPYVTLEMSA